MQTQKDHVEAYAFQAGRMSAALVTGEAAYLEAPARRAKLGLVAGLAIAALIVIGFFLYGLIRHQLDTARLKSQVPTPAPTSSTAPVVPGVPQATSQPSADPTERRV